MRYIITSESVTEGHPDKICDQISDAILDDLLAQDPDSRVAVETLTTTGLVLCAGEITTKGYCDVHKVVRQTLKEIGYDDPEFGIDSEDAGVMASIHDQSPDIAQGVNTSKEGKKEQGAGDQGMMYGYACNETPELMPIPIMLAHKLTKKLAEVRKKNIIKGLGPDGKSQVSIEYENDKPVRISAVVIAQQHKKNISEGKLKDKILEKVIKPICEDLMDDDTKIHINATGAFYKGGPEADTGLTGRKIIVDTYGGVGRHGGGCFSGKDPSKVDRSGAYMARYIAKNIVAAGLADKAEIQLSYAIGVAEPTSVFVNSFGTNKIPEEKIAELVRKHFPLTPKGIITHLDLKRPIYKKTAAYGHFGRDEPNFTWEKTDKAEVLKAEAFPQSESEILLKQPVEQSIINNELEPPKEVDDEISDWGFSKENSMSDSEELEAKKQELQPEITPAKPPISSPISDPYSIIPGIEVEIKPTEPEVGIESKPDKKTQGFLKKLFNNKKKIKEKSVKEEIEPEIPKQYSSDPKEDKKEQKSKEDFEFRWDWE